MTQRLKQAALLRARRNEKSSAKNTALSVRAVAAQIVVQVLDQKQSLAVLLPHNQAHINPQDLPLLQEICFGVCRVLPRLEQVLRALLVKPLKGKVRIVHCLLLVALYQLLYMRIPAHAAVDEAVNATAKLKVEHFRGLVNGVLRRFLREQEQILAKVDQHWQTLHPEWLVNQLKTAYPNWREIIDANNQKPPMWLRVNPQRCSVAEYQALLAQQGIESYCPQSAQALCLVQPRAVSGLPHFADGWVSVQDLHAQWAAQLLAPQNGELILDACAAPGGKTTHLLELAPRARVVALDIEPHRLQRVAENLTRMRQQAQLVCADAATPAQWIAQVVSNEGESAVQFDRILLDAPCSASGVIRRHPDIKWLRQETDIAQLATLQARILDGLWAKLKPNGVLVYATCSVLPQENSQQIAAFLARHSDAELLPLPFTPQKSCIGHQFIPHAQAGDGFYYAKLRKCVY
ncbi:16S rRNA (cytosine(967)-C(5))-methyltransferase RsmB [Necropsobacter massiliensis]|uniref:16S rRNA (cytosine(967)-C(5))-methyltransferase RsmB n=1 Tax=Necropsobacter massiliensis TaxID=1400001 RepID=UPI0005959A02|nr:16S rRNA (cytosine(967)-C(5))-methyltransferase RsmB [Necropsobacter massiliensis]